MFKKSQDRKLYKSDLTDAQWAIVEPMIRLPSRTSAEASTRRRHAEVLNTVLYLHRSAVNGICCA